MVHSRLGRGPAHSFVNRLYAQTPTFIYIHSYIYKNINIHTRNGDAGVVPHGKSAAVGEGHQQLGQPQILHREQEPVFALEPDDRAAICVLRVIFLVGGGLGVCVDVFSIRDMYISTAVVRPERNRNNQYSRTTTIDPPTHNTYTQ